MIEAFGAFLGSLVGLVAILLGAMRNAQLNRQRDDRLRKQEQRALAAALRGELLAVRNRAAWRWWAFHNDSRGDEHRHIGKASRPKWDWTIPERDIFDSAREKLPLLDPELVSKVLDTYERIDDYVTALRLSYAGGPKTKWIKHILGLIFEHCTQTANSLGNVYGLRLPEVRDSIDVVGKREHNEVKGSPQDVNFELRSNTEPDEYNSESKG